MSDEERYEEEDEYEEEPCVECPRCGGSGITVEGWDCRYCDGDGYLDF
jgi:DnaJ-class molecular chaperone